MGRSLRKSNRTLAGIGDEAAPHAGRVFLDWSGMVKKSGGFWLEGENGEKCRFGGEKGGEGVEGV